MNSSTSRLLPGIARARVDALAVSLATCRHDFFQPRPSHHNPSILHPLESHGLPLFGYFCILPNVVNPHGMESNPNLVRLPLRSTLVVAQKRHS